MRSGLRLVAISTLGGLVLCGPRLAPQPVAAATSLDDKTIVHVLNRLAFGPRPGDVEKVRALGLQAYIDQQLHPDRIPDAAVAERLSGLSTLRMSSRDIADQFERPLMEARRERQQAQRSVATPPAPPGGDGGVDGQPPQMPAPAMQRANRLIIELSDQKVLRAVYSERQLEEALTDFWFNHFNVDARKGRDRFLLTEYEREAIRPHVLGKFRDLLEATAKSPAMLFYLDNWMSADPNGPHPDAARGFGARGGAFGRSGFGRGGFGGPMFPAAPQNPRPNVRRGLNENYARELMELHTLGVDGGYTQKDVTEVARAFTGWTIQPPMLGGGYRFEPRIHDPGKKTVLGHAIDGGGERDGKRVLDLLASNPSTARFIATKLVTRFVSDVPPPALVDRAAAKFRQTDGDLFPAQWDPKLGIHVT